MNKYIRPLKFIILPLISAKIVMCDNYVKLKKSSDNFTIHYKMGNGCGCYDHNIKIKYGLNRDNEMIYPYSYEANLFQGFNPFISYKHYEHYNDFNFIGKISLPEDNSFFLKELMYKNYPQMHYKSNSINLKETYDLSNIKDIEYILNNINNDTHYYVFMASRKGNIDMLSWLHKNYKKNFNYDDAIDQAIIHNKVKVLYWFEKEGYKIKYNDSSVTEAIRHSNIEILEWLKKRGYHIHISDDVKSSIFLWRNKKIADWLKKNFVI